MSRNSLKSKKDRSKCWELIAIYVTCTATIIIAIASLKASCISREAVDNSIATTSTMQKEFEIGNRPYVMILAEETFFSLEENKVVSVLKNWGKSIASNVVVNYSIEGFNGTLAGRLEFYTLPPGGVRPFKITIFRNYGKIAEVDELINKKLEEIAKGSKGVILKTEITYEWEGKTYPEDKKEGELGFIGCFNVARGVFETHVYKDERR